MCAYMAGIYTDNILKNHSYYRISKRSISLHQINHKYPERRLLVAESCGALAPYLPVSICIYC